MTFNGATTSSGGLVEGSESDVPCGSAATRWSAACGGT